MIAFVAQKKFYHIKRDNMVLTDWMDDQSLIKQLNKMSFEEIIQMLKSELTHGGEVEELENGLICVYKAGSSDNEHLVRLLISPFCIHRSNYIGHIYACDYFTRDKDKKFDYTYDIVATKKKR